MRGSGSPTRPRCPCCASTAGPIVPSGLVRVARVHRGGRMVQRPLAWVQCRRNVSRFGVILCQWGWWSAHPGLVARAKTRPDFRLARRQKQPVAARRKARKG